MTGQITFPNKKPAQDMQGFMKVMEVLTNPEKANDLVLKMIDETNNLALAKEEYANAIKIAATVEKADTLYESTVDKTSKMIHDAEAMVIKCEEDCAKIVEDTNSSTKVSLKELSTQRSNLDNLLKSITDKEVSIDAKQKKLDASESRIENSSRKLEEDKNTLKGNLDKYDSLRKAIIL